MNNTPAASHERDNHPGHADAAIEHRVEGFAPGIYRRVDGVRPLKNAGTVDEHIDVAPMSSHFLVDCGYDRWVSVVSSAHQMIAGRKLSSQFAQALFAPGVDTDIKAIGSESECSCP